MSSGNKYVLGRNYLSSLRLNAQHLIWKDQLGYVLHPSIPAREDMKVADVGTGTGIWLVELSRLLPPSAQLQGFDIDLSQAPPNKWLPANVSIHELDAFSDVPEELVEKYDVVHIAIVMLLVTKNEPIPLLRNLLRLLKPGGYIQWDELDFGNRRVVSADSLLRTDHVQALLEYVAPWENSLGPKSWIGDLSSIFTDQGLKEVRFDRFAMAPEYYRYDNDKSLTAYEEFSYNILDPRGKGEGVHLRELIAKAFEECQKGVGISADMVVALGRKL